MAENLTTLTAVKEWLGLPPNSTEPDELLNRIISSVSAGVLNFLNRESIAYRVQSEVYDGYGKSFMVLRDYPVFEVLEINVLGIPIPPAIGDGITSPWTNGWVLNKDSDNRPAEITLFGKAFPNARSSVRVRYSSGYVCSRTGSISSPFTYQADSKFNGDVKVLINGVEAQKIGSSPTVGEYSVSPTGLYTFSSLDDSKSFEVFYSYVPRDIEQAVWEMVGSRYKYRERIGQSSKSLGGQETVSFERNRMDDYVMSLLNPYRRVTPL